MPSPRDINDALDLMDEDERQRKKKMQNQKNQQYLTGRQVLDAQGREARDSANNQKKAYLKAAQSAQTGIDQRRARTTRDRM